MAVTAIGDGIRQAVLESADERARLNAEHGVGYLIAADVEISAGSEAMPTGFPQTMLPSRSMPKPVTKSANRFCIQRHHLEARNPSEIATGLAPPVPPVAADSGSVDWGPSRQ